MSTVFSFLRFEVFLFGSIVQIPTIPLQCEDGRYRDVVTGGESVRGAHFFALFLQSLFFAPTVSGKLHSPALFRLKNFSASQPSPRRSYDDERPQRRGAAIRAEVPTDTADHRMAGPRTRQEVQTLVLNILLMLQYVFID